MPMRVKAWYDRRCAFPHKTKISRTRRELPLNAVSQKNGGYAGLYHLRCDSDNFIMKTMKARPDYQMDTSAMRSFDQEAGVKPQLMLKSNKARDDFDPRKRNWLIWLSYILGSLLR